MADKLLTLKQRIRSLKLVPGSGGAFEVTVNGAKLHSKLASGEFPDPERLLKLVKAKL